MHGFGVSHTIELSHKWSHFAPAALIVRCNKMPRTLQIPTRDGRPVLLRPLVPADEEKLREAIARFSNRSRYLRFFTGIARIPDPVIHRLAEADGDEVATRPPANITQQHQAQ